MTGGRIKRVKDYIGNEDFMLTYGDGVSNVDINDLVRFHKEHGKIATMTAIQPKGRFGILDINSENCIESFREKQRQDVGWVNGGFMALKPEIFDYLEGDETVFEREPLERVASEGNLMAYCHDGFWQCMDTMRDKKALEEMLNVGQAPWKVWD